MLSPLRAWEREIDRMFEDFPLFRWPRFRELERHFPRELRLQAPSLDMYEEKNELVIKAEVPGLSKDDIEITLDDSTLTIKGEKKKHGVGIEIVAMLETPHGVGQSAVVQARIVRRGRI